MKCSEATSGIFCYNLLAETLIVFGLITNYLMERVLSFMNFVLTEKSEHRFYIQNQHEHCFGEESGQKTPVHLTFCVNFSLKTQMA